MTRYDDIQEVRKARTFDEIRKFNPFHDSLGRFSSGGSAASFTVRTKDPKKQHMADMAIARMKQQNATQPTAAAKPKVNYDSHGFADHDNADYHNLHSGRQYYQQQQLTAAQKKAADNYLESNPERNQPYPNNLYSHSQNMNYKMANGEQLTGKYAQTHDDLMSSMHNLGYNVNLQRYDHAGMVNSLLQASGAGNNYEKMTQKQLERALVGKTVQENKFISTTYNDFKNAPQTSNDVFATRAVKINYRAPAHTQAMMPGRGPGGDLGELILAPGQKGKIVGVRLTGQMVRRKGTQRYNQPRIEIDIELE